MTNEQVRHLYHHAGGQAKHTDGEWVEIERDIRSIVDAPTIKEAAKHVEWCMDWEEWFTAMQIASTIREEHRRISTDEPIPTIINSGQNQGHEPRAKMTNEQVDEFINWLTRRIVAADSNAWDALENNPKTKSFFQTRSATFSEVKEYFTILSIYPPTNHKEQEPLGKVALE